MTTKEIDFNARYRWKQYDGIAFYLTGYKQVWAPAQVWMTNADEDDEDYDEDDGYWTDDPYGEGEWVDDTDIVIGVMVGDDRKHEIEPDDLILLDDEDYCGTCGQTGCGWH